MDIKLNYKYSLLFMLGMGLSCCNPLEENEPITPVSPKAGKLHKLNFKNSAADPDRYSYTFTYDDVTGQILKISNDSVDVCTYLWPSEDSLVIEWRYADNSFVYDIWMVSLEDSAKLKSVSSDLYLSTFISEIYRATYQDNGTIDSIYIGDYFPFQGALNHSYNFTDGNCTQFVQYYTLVSTPVTNVIDNEYLPISLNSIIPLQIPYRDLYSNGRFDRYLQGLFVLQLAGVECLPRNQLLLAQSGLRSYSYTFDECERVASMTTINSQMDTIVIASMEYY